MDPELKWAITHYLPNLRRYAYGLTGNRDTADDLVQDCLERAMRKGHLWQRRGSVKNWLFRILYRQFLNDRRWQRNRGVTVDLDEMDGAEALPPRQDGHVFYGEVMGALMKLPRRQRAAMLLVVLEGHSYDEAAAALGVPIGTVRSRLNRARETLEASAPLKREAAHLRRVK